MSGLTPVDAGGRGALDLMSLFNTGSDTGVQLRCIPQLDGVPWGAGDLVYEDGQTFGGVPTVGNFFAGGGRGWPRYDPKLSVLLGAGLPATSGTLAVATSAPASKSGPVYVWVLPVRRRAFEVIGDGTTPARSDGDSFGTGPGNLSIDGIDSGNVFGGLAYHPPSGGQSGILLKGNAFYVPSSGIVSNLVQIVALPNGQALKPNARWHVRFTGN